MKLPNFELQIKGKLSMTQMMILIINYVHPKIIPAKTSWYLDIEVLDVLQWKVEVLRWQSWPLLRTDHRAVAFTEVLKGASWLDLMVTRVLSWRQEIKLAFKKLYFEFFGQSIFFQNWEQQKTISLAQYLIMGQEAAGGRVARVSQKLCSCRYNSLDLLLPL